MDERDALYRAAIRQLQRDTRPAARQTLADWLLQMAGEESAVWPFPLTRDDRLFLAQTRISAR